LPTATTCTLQCGNAGRNPFVIQRMKVVPLNQTALIKLPRGVLLVTIAIAAQLRKLS
jgi:hypothetical protein